MDDSLTRTVDAFFRRAVDAPGQQGWRRYRGGLEVGAGALAWLVCIAVTGGSVVGVIGCLPFAALLVLYRRLPAVAFVVGSVTAAVAGLLCIVRRIDFLMAPLPVIVICLGVMLFGLGRYGMRVLHWLGLALVVLLAVEMTATELVQFDSLFSLGVLIEALSVAVITSGLLGAPLLVGLLARAESRRRSAQTAELRVLQQRDALQDSVTLEQERNRVARDVHDIVAHSLAVVIAQADGARYAARTAPDAADDALATIAATARAALVDVRALLTELRHSQEPGPQPGVGDLDALVRGFRESGLVIDWTSYGTASPMTDATGLAVYRVAQEALTNALRHGSRRTPVQLEFDWADTSFSLTVTNDLDAAEDERGEHAHGHGVPGMRERAALAGGSLAVGAGTNGRFRVRATFPINRAEAPTQVYLREA